MAERSSPCAFHCSIARRMSSRSLRPTISSNLRKPICAIYSRTSWAMKGKKVRTREADPPGAEQARDPAAPPRLQLAVRLDDDAVAQDVHDQRLLGLRQA